MFWTAHDGAERLHGVADGERDQGVPHDAHAGVHRQALANVLLAEDESHVASYSGMDIGIASLRLSIAPRSRGIDT